MNDVKSVKEMIMAKKWFGTCLFGFLLVFMMLCPVSLTAQSDGTITFLAILQRGQNVSNLHIFSEQNPVTYLVFYGQTSGKAYFVKREDIFSTERLVFQFGKGFNYKGIETFSIEFNKMTGLDMMGEENLEPIGQMAWGNSTATGNSDLPYLLQGIIIPKDARSKQIFETLVLGQLKRVN
jgi:hypothetical protein